MEKPNETQPESFEQKTWDIKSRLKEIAEANARKGHQWRQRGTQLICRSCLSEHATFIPVGIRLVGFDERGRPRFE